MKQSEYKSQILNYVRRQGFVTVTQVARHFKIHYYTAERILLTLANEGFLKVITTITPRGYVRRVYTYADDI